MIVSKAINLLQLQAELDDAGVSVNGLSTGGTYHDGSYDLWAHDDDGHLIELPEEAVAVVETHAAVFPDPEPSRDERLSVVIDAGKAAIAEASTLAQVKAVFGATLEGLKGALGSQP